MLSYHSLEDRKIKRLFKRGTVTVRGEDESFTEVAVARTKPWTEVIKGTQMASEEEQQLNSRSRSAKLRVGEVVDASLKGASLEESQGRTKTAFMGTKQLLKKARREADETNTLA